MHHNIAQFLVFLTTACFTEQQWTLYYSRLCSLKPEKYVVITPHFSCTSATSTALYVAVCYIDRSVFHLVHTMSWRHRMADKDHVPVWWVEYPNFIIYWRSRNDVLKLLNSYWLSQIFTVDQPWLWSLGWKYCLIPSLSDIPILIHHLIEDWSHSCTSAWPHSQCVLGQGTLTHSLYLSLSLISTLTILHTDSVETRLPHPNTQ